MRSSIHRKMSVFVSGEMCLRRQDSMQVVTTVFFDGQFWIALIKKQDSSGTIFTGKYTFGPEPTNPRLLQFYLNDYVHVPCYPGAPLKERSVHCLNRGDLKAGGSALDQWKVLHQAELASRKQHKRERLKLDERQRFALRQEKKKRKRRGR